MSRTEASLLINSAITYPSPLCAIQIHVQARYQKICRTVNGELTTIEDYPTVEPFFFMLSVLTHFLSLPILRDYHVTSSLCLGLNLPPLICHSVAMMIGSYAPLLGLQGFHMQAHLHIVNRNITDEALEWATDEETTIIMDADDLVTRKGVANTVLVELRKQRFHSDEFSNTACVVCLEELNSKVALTRMPLCSHVFHQQCILRWLKQSKTCPVCRRNVEDSVA